MIGSKEEENSRLGVILHCRFKNLYFTINDTKVSQFFATHPGGQPLVTLIDEFAVPF